MAIYINPAMNECSCRNCSSYFSRSYNIKQITVLSAVSCSGDDDDDDYEVQ